MTEFTFEGLTLTDAKKKLEKPFDRFDPDKKAMRLILLYLLSKLETPAEIVEAPVGKKKKNEAVSEKLA